MKKIKIIFLLVTVLLLSGCNTVYEMNISGNKSMKVKMIKYIEKDLYDGYEADANLVTIDGKDYYAVETVQDIKSIDDVSVNGDIYANLHVLDESYGTDDENQFLFSRQKYFLFDEYSFILRIEDVINITKEEKKEYKDELGKYYQHKINQLGGFVFNVNLPSKADSSNATRVLNDGKSLSWDSKYFMGESIVFRFKIYNGVAVKVLIAIVVLIILAFVGSLIANKQRKIEEQYK